MKHIIKLNNSKSFAGCYSIKYRRKEYIFKTAQEARNKGDEIMVMLFFNYGVPTSQIYYYDNIDK